MTKSDKSEMLKTSKLKKSENKNWKLENSEKSEKSEKNIGIYGQKCEYVGRIWHYSCYVVILAKLILTLR